MSARRALVTGASGFVGRHMTHLLLECGYDVVGLERSAGDVPPGAQLIAADLADPASLAAVPREWDLVIHLAAASIPSLFSTVAPVASKVQITLNLLDHLRGARVLLASSCHVYAPSSEPRRESDPILPQGRYGLSKHLVEQLAPYYSRTLDVRVARPYNHLGPGLRPELVVPSLLRRLAAAPRGDRSPVVMQGRNSVRDFIDVRDVVAAYLAILELPRAADAVFNVCSGRGCTIAELVREVLRLVGAEREVVFQEHAMSSDDTPVMVGDPTKLARAAGVRARHGLAESLSTMLAEIEGERS